MGKNKKGIADEDLVHLCTHYIEEADSYLDEVISDQRARNLRYYHGANPDNLPTIRGRSKIVDTVVRDTVEWILPSLLRIFNSGDEVVTIEPEGDEDVENAKNAEQWVNYVHMRMNPGFLNNYQWFKDALLQKTGWEKVYWKTNETTERIEADGVTIDELMYLQESDDNDVLNYEQYAGVEMIATETGEIIEEAVELYNVVYNERTIDAKICEEVFPPEEVLYLEDAKLDRDSWWFLATKSNKRIAELRDEGFDVDIDIQGGEISADGMYDEETQARRPDQAGYDDNSQTRALQADPTLRKVWVYDCYIRADVDGDGDSEWNRAVICGDTLLLKERVDYPPLYMITPLPESHRLTGMAIADLVTDLQELMTALNRQVLDNIYLTNNPRSEIDMSGANEHTINDYLDNAIGGYVRVKKPNTINPLQTAQLQPWTFNLLEYWEGKKENRAGVTRYNQGLDADSLNKTASGMMQIMNASLQRIELIARIFAETGVKDKIQGILDLSIKYPEYTGERILKLSGKTLEITSDALKGKYDLIINPGIGTGNREQTSQNLMTLLNTYERLTMAGMGPGSEEQMVTKQNIFNATREFIKNMGFKNTKDFITDPSDETAERDPVIQPPPSPEQQKLQMEQQKMQGEREMKQQEMQQEMMLEQQKAQSEQAKLQLEAEIKGKELQIKEAELELKRQELKLKQYETGNRIAQGNIPVDNTIDIEVKREEIANRKEELAIKRAEAEAKIVSLGGPSQVHQQRDAALDALLEESDLRKQKETVILDYLDKGRTKDIVDKLRDINDKSSESTAGEVPGDITSQG